MPTTETPFLTFWRALDAELAALGEGPSSPIRARLAFRTLQSPKECASAAASHGQEYTPPPHQHNAGKTFR